MSRFTRRVALVVAGAGVVAGAAVGVAQAAAPEAGATPPAAVNVVPNDDCGSNECFPDCPPPQIRVGDQCAAPDARVLPEEDALTVAGAGRHG